MASPLNRRPYSVPSVVNPIRAGHQPRVARPRPVDRRLKLVLGVLTTRARTPEAIPALGHRTTAGATPVIRAVARAQRARRTTAGRVQPARPAVVRLPWR